MKKRINKKEKNKKRNIPFIIFTIIFICGGIALTFYFLNLKKAKEGFQTVANLKQEPSIQTDDNGKNYLDYYLINNTVVQAEFKDLFLQNQDIVGWVKINGTPIDYPVMQTPNDEQYYLYKNFDKEYSSAGSIFMGAEGSITRPSENMILYGHHMITQTMFKPLDKYLDEKFYKKHKYITFNTLRQTGTYEIIAVLQTKIYYYESDGFMYYEYSNLEDKKTFDKYVNECNKLKLYDTDAKAEFGDQLVTLSTCAYHTSNGRLVVVAKKVDGLSVDLEQEPIEVINTEGN